MRFRAIADRLSDLEREQLALFLAGAATVRWSALWLAIEDAPQRARRLLAISEEGLAHQREAEPTPLVHAHPTGTEGGRSP